MLQASPRNSVADQGLAGRERLRNRQRLDELFARGAVGKSRLVLIRALPNGLAFSRVAVLVGKAAGTHVKRNRLRRRLRAAFRTHKQELPLGWDAALLARQGLLDADHEALVRDLKKAFARATEEDARRTVGDAGKPQDRPPAAPGTHIPTGPGRMPE